MKQCINNKFLGIRRYNYVMKHRNDQNKSSRHRNNHFQYIILIHDFYNSVCHHIMGILLIHLYIN